MMSCAVTNSPLLLMIGLAECSEVGLRRDSSSAGLVFHCIAFHRIAVEATANG